MYLAAHAYEGGALAQPRTGGRVFPSLDTPLGGASEDLGKSTTAARRGQRASSPLLSLRIAHCEIASGKRALALARGSCEGQGGQGEMFVFGMMSGGAPRQAARGPPGARVPNRLPPLWQSRFYANQGMRVKR